MRIKVFRETVATNDGREALPGSIFWADKQLPVMALVPTGGARSKREVMVVGTLTRIQREEADGWITGELWTAGEFGVKGLAAQADLDQLQRHESSTEDLMVIAKARLAGVHLGDRPCWDGMVIE